MTTFEFLFERPVVYIIVSVLKYLFLQQMYETDDEYWDGYFHPKNLHRKVHKAIRNNDFEKVKQLVTLSQKDSSYTLDLSYNNNQLFREAARTGQIDVLKYFIDQGVRITASEYRFCMHGTKSHLRSGKREFLENVKDDVKVDRWSLEDTVS